MTEHVQTNMRSMKHFPMETISWSLYGLFVKLCNFIMGAEYADPHQHTQRSVLDDVANEMENGVKLKIPQEQN